MDLNSMSPQERQSALQRLCAEGDDQAVHHIGAALLASHWPTCEDLSEALARIGSRAARAALMKALKARRHHTRSAAVKALSQLGGADARAAIRELENDKSYEVRQDVAEALRRLS